MHAGFAKACITPPIGSPMQGIVARSMHCGCVSVHDDLYLRALYLRHAGEAAVILGADLFGLNPETATALREKVADELGLPIERVMLNTSGTLCGPVAGPWNYDTPDATVLSDLMTAAVFAACQAHNTARPARIWAGQTRSRLPLNARQTGPDHNTANAPNPEGPIDDTLPVCLIRERDGDSPIALLFSLACEASTMSGFEISADYPGAAAQALHKRLHAECAMFLQGTGADARPGVIANGAAWRPGDWGTLEEAGRQIADDIAELLAAGLMEVEPQIRASVASTRLPLLAPPDSSELGELIERPLSPDAPPEHRTRRRWAEEQLARCRFAGAMAREVEVTVHGVQLADHVRLVGFSGPAVAELGHLVRDIYTDGVTFALGSTDGSRLCLPTTAMLSEGGEAVADYYRYHHPAPLDRGFEQQLRDALDALRLDGVL
jgi:neutral ceramidase